MTTPQLIAHRGGPVYAPENTLAAFRHAIGLGADWLECDVHLSRDGVPVVIHDESVDRTTDGTGRIADLPLAEVQALDAGNGERVPTFAQLLALAQAAEIGLLVEVKSPHLYPDLEAKIVQAIVEADYVNKTILQSFDPRALEVTHALNPAIRLCQLYEQPPLRLAALPPYVSLIGPMAEAVIFYPWLMRQAHATGRQVFVWFGRFEHPLLLRWLIALGVDGLIVNDPLALAKILKRDA